MALARALAIRPRILLLDEPFGALDKNLRLDMQLEVKSLQRDLGITTILVTHDQDEAMSTADRIAVLRAGRVEQVATPAAIYDQPASLFVAQFIGSTNILHGEIAAADRTHASIRLDAGVTLSVPVARSFRPGERAILSVRPEQLFLSDRAGSGPLSRRAADDAAARPQSRARGNAAARGLDQGDRAAHRRGGATIRRVPLRPDRRRARLAVSR